MQYQAQSAEVVDGALNCTRCRGDGEGEGLCSSMLQRAQSMHRLAFMCFGGSHAEVGSKSLPFWYVLLSQHSPGTLNILIAQVQVLLCSMHTIHSSVMLGLHPFASACLTAQAVGWELSHWQPFSASCPRPHSLDCVYVKGHARPRAW
jgi:hypothetical protein